MGYTNVFGGQTIFPSQLSYIAITFAADITLQWPREQQVGGVNVVADFMDMNATAPSLNVDMPDATATGTGNKATFNNVGANAFTVRDSAGGAIITVSPGEQWIVVLTDNTTAAGTWTTFQLGATVSVANAAALAGAGLKAIATTLNQRIDSNVEAATPFTVVDSDRANCLIYTGGAGTCNLPNPATVGNDWFFMLRNSGSGTLNVVPPSGTIDGGASINLDPNDSCFIFTDGTNFFTVGLSTGSTIAFDFVSIAVPGSGDFVLSGANLNRIAYRFTGALTGNRTIVVPATTQQYWIDNQTTGAFTLSVAVAGQPSPPQVAQNNSIIFYCDGTQVVNAVSQSAVSFPISVGQGGTGATDAATARTNLGVPPSTRVLTAGNGLTGGGDLSADRAFAVGAGTGILANPADVELDITGLLAQATPSTDDELPIQDIGLGAKRKITIASLLALIPSPVQGNVKQVTLGRANTTTLADDPDLSGFALQPSSIYVVEGVLRFNGNGATANGFRWQLDFNGQIANVETLNGSAFSYQQGGTAEQLVTDALSAFSQTKATFDNAGIDEIVEFKVGVITQSDYVANTAIDLQWAQGTSFATETRLEEGSWMRVTQVG